jgi:phage terminase large subunit-like protein
MSDSEIEELKKLKPEVAEEFLDKNYAYIYGKYHRQNDTVFSMDKGWDIAKFLLKKADFSTNKILTELDKKYIKSDIVKQINKVLAEITVDQLLDLCDPNELIEKKVYRAEIGKSKESIEYNFDLYKAGFKKAAELNSGIVINYN